MNVGSDHLEGLSASGRRARRRRRAGLGRRVGLAIGWLLIALALAALGYELWLSTEAGAYRMVAAGELWYRLDSGSLNLSQAVIQRYVHPWVWEPAIVTLLRWPAWSLLGAPGVVLVLACWPWRNR
ncbi:MAG TPA: hypothetical protein VFG47_14265 [Geminicoccaceae bacterium]|nr:hypothetical protein [Geminicoccaceae bacterium]